ncbi:MAG: hypothetical protein D3910_07505 [Candidatus Electrothrix sp. ATG2]|nr:hypothetical protein [Candidatus Electrothrix sp. ATG2]
MPKQSLGTSNITANSLFRFFRDSGILPDLVRDQYYGRLADVLDVRGGGRNKSHKCLAKFSGC